MTTISVPGPARESFHKDRALSDLLREQLRHFQHVETRLPPEQRSGLSPGDVSTPEGASRYVAYMTRVIRSLPAAKPAGSPRPVLVPDRVPTPGVVIDIAAGAETDPEPASSGGTPTAGGASVAKKKSSKRKKARKPRGSKS